jgi:hypothetical protein
MNQVNSVGTAATPSLADEMHPIPKAAIWVTVYHFLLVAISAIIIIVLYVKTVPGEKVSVGGLGQLPATAFYSFGLGLIGGVLYASRWVIHSVARKDYIPRKILWQIVSPIHGAILAVFVIVAIKAGILGIAGVDTSSSEAASRYVWFVMAVSFMTGFASKIVIERVEEMTRALFGKEFKKIPDAGSEPPTSDSGAGTPPPGGGDHPDTPNANG